MDKYIKYKNIFGCISDDDDIRFLMTKCPIEDYSLINSIINSNKRRTKLNNKLGYLKMFEAIKIMNDFPYKNDCDKYLSRLFPLKNEPDEIQSRVLNKIKDGKSKDLTLIDIPYSEKKCPHCNRTNTAPFDTEYMICGVDAIGKSPLDMDACLRDWCFVCGKKLCKHWYRDHLWNENNRKHNECCFQYAKDHGENENDYCNCHSICDLLIH